MSLDFKKPVAYLENQDFDEKGNLLLSINVPVVIMLQASWCPHCSTAKPAFQQFADEVEGKVFCATIQADGERNSEKELGKRVSVLKKGFRGFPDYLLYINGKAVNKEITGRDVESLKKFAFE